MFSSHNFPLDFPGTGSIAVRVDGPSWVATAPGAKCRACGGASIAMGDADPEDEDDGQQATPQANKERRKGQYRRGEQAGSRAPARTASTGFEGTVRACGDPDRFSSTAGGCGSRRSLREHRRVEEHQSIAEESVVTIQAPIGGRRFADRQCSWP